ncbi:MAG: hypothetical protein ACTSXF_14950, partial [Promethearchaeota archaeon]
IIFSLILATFMIAATPVAVIGATPPAWLPTETDLEGYTLFYQNSTEIEDYCGTNMTTWIQVWYKNSTTNNTLAIIAAGYVDMGKDVWSQELPANVQTALHMTLPDFNGTTNWDLFAYYLKVVSMGNIQPVTLSGWDRALQGNGTFGLFDYFIAGTIGTKFVLVFSLKLDFDFWLFMPQSQMYSNLASFLTIFVSAMAQMGTALSSNCPNSSQAPGIPAPLASAESDQYTSPEETKSFAESISAKLASGSIPGYSTPILIAATLITISVILLKAERLRKKQL